MLNHKDPEVQTILALVEGQRDYAMGIAASLAKENAELKARIAELTKSQESEDGSVQTNGQNDDHRAIN